MDSLTQAVLGATVAAACVPKNQRRNAAVAGALLGTLPDLDVLIDYGDAVSNFTYHRGFSHSLFVLIPFGVLLWFIMNRYWSLVRQAPRAWFYAIELVLITHVLLDAHTVYGTQLFWPIATPPTMWSTVFIIDPLYTLPLLVASLLLLIRPRSKVTHAMVSLSLVVSTAYLGWSWFAKTETEKAVVAALGDQVKGNLLTTPTPMNTLLWRILVLQDDHYLEGYYTVHKPEREIEFSRRELNIELLDQSNHIDSVQRLSWFTHGFMKANVIENQLTISDLRMGFEEVFVFTHAVAERDTTISWQPIKTRQLQTEFGIEAIKVVWEKL